MEASGMIPGLGWGVIAPCGLQELPRIPLWKWGRKMLHVGHLTVSVCCPTFRDNAGFCLQRGWKLPVRAAWLCCIRLNQSCFCWRLKRRLTAWEPWKSGKFVETLFYSLHVFAGIAHYFTLFRALFYQLKFTSMDLSLWCGFHRVISQVPRWRWRTWILFGTRPLICQLQSQSTPVWRHHHLL